MRPDKPLVWLRGAIKTPPFSAKARLEAGFMLRRLQTGEMLAMPESRPMPALGRRCHELRISDGGVEWRIVYRIDRDAIVIGDVFARTSRKTPKRVVDECGRRFQKYDRDCERGG